MKLEALPDVYDRWRGRQSERDVRFRIIDTVVKGEGRVFDPDEEEIERRSTNFIQVAMEDTAEAASVLPTVRVSPIDSLKAEQKEQAERQERIGMGYMVASEWDVLINLMGLDWLAFGGAPIVVWPDLEDGTIKIVKKDPRQFYPDDTYKPGDRQPRAAIFAREVAFTALPDREKALIDEEWHRRGFSLMNQGIHEDLSVTIVEYFDSEVLLTAGLVGMGGGSVPAQYPTEKTGWVPVEFERIVNPIGKSLVLVADKLSLDGEMRGQYDQIIGSQAAHQRLFGLMMDFSDQAVYSDIYVKGLVGELPWGGGAVIQLGPDGDIGRVPPAVSSLDVQRDLEHLVDGIHLGGRWPKSRPGEIDQAIASAKFLEATAGMMNTLIRTMHGSYSRTLTKALNLAFALDLALATEYPNEWGDEAVATGVLRNQTFVEEYRRTQIKTRFPARVDYGISFGRDPAQSTVLGVQLTANGFLARETFMESVDGIHDVQRELRRRDVEELLDFLKADLVQKLQSQQLPPDAIVELIEGREEGKTMTALYREFVLQPQEEALAGAQMTPLLGAVGPEGSPLPPGVVGPGGAPPGGAPVPPAPAVPELLARLNVPAGPGGTLGAQVQGGPPV